MRKTFDILTVMVTNACNMRCAHCLRGEAERKNVDLGYIDALLKDVSSIGSLVITGGEPSLNPKAIKHIAKVIRENDIALGSVALITNGKVVSDSFIAACAILFSLSDDKMCDYLAVSKDIFHEPVPEENIQKLATLRAFQPDGHHNDWHRVSLKNLGRAKNLTSFNKETPKKPEVSYEMYTDDTICFENVIAMTVDGYIIPECDFSFENVKDWAIGHVSDPHWAEKAIGLSYDYESDEERRTA